jgi:hypothetical protein
MHMPVAPAARLFAPPAVTYETPGKTGLQDLQWLDNLSKPKVRMH